MNTREVIVEDVDSQGDSQQSQDSVLTVIQEERHEVLYFAYGSNLSTAQMRARCPLSTAIGLGFLPRWRWIINSRGYANILPPSSSPSSSSSSSSTTTTDDGVYGLLYLLPPRDEESLDRFEGVPHAYEKLRCEVRWVRDGDGKLLAGEEGGGEPVKALVYVDERRTDDGMPAKEYVGRMERGIEDAVRNWGLDEGYANRVMRKWWTKV
ncbi:hypothetical protein MY5147_001048 [Beauveria neobassiana]|uniref:gamma-glutamylcyclotransferase n=1 Tax=Beauveria bassiana TaxID=176275 RepID=A0A2S7XYU8_BEABA|nr:hypothetical protein BB8028_0001g11420 [Beauveria bassiana]